MPRSFYWFVVLVCLVLYLDWSRDKERVVVDLGIARFPGGNAAAPTIHDWLSADRGRGYRLAYAHGRQAVDALSADHEQIGARFHLERIDDVSFRWRLPPACLGREWSCIYRAVLDRNELDLEPLVGRIDFGFASESWTTTEAARSLLAFVQQIPYKLPTREAFGILPPALVASQNWGDCDSKSLLLIYLLERIDIEAVLLVSEAHAHALVGIAVPSSGNAFHHKGRRYAWAETTAPNAPLGWLPPEMKTPNDWRIVPLR